MLATYAAHYNRLGPAVQVSRPGRASSGQRAGVGLHCFGFLGDDVEQATSAFYPGWAAMFTQVSRERGFPPPTRRQFDATRGPDGAFFVGDPETVAAKCLRVSEQLGGVERINLQMTNPRLRHADLLHSIELLGTGVVPLVKS